jgi:hypothetical protein
MGAHPCVQSQKLPVAVTLSHPGLSMASGSNRRVIGGCWRWGFLHTVSHCLFMTYPWGETAALSRSAPSHSASSSWPRGLSKGMGRGQNSPVDKSSEKTSPGALERKKSLPVPDITTQIPLNKRGILLSKQPSS